MVVPKFLRNLPVELTPNGVFGVFVTEYGYPYPIFARPVKVIGVNQHFILRITPQEYTL
ncbi:hypothetical protein MTsPCn5_28410 [Croceitalea sp. MTPC5]|nr:hypothetical protein MTsPCn5_28410 [Croceitalea sp. MTPC5]